MCKTIISFRMNFIWSGKKTIKNGCIIVLRVNVLYNHDDQKRLVYFLLVADTMTTLIVASSNIDIETQCLNSRYDTNKIAVLF